NSIRSDRLPPFLTPPSCPAKAGHPVAASPAGGPVMSNIIRCLLGRPPSRATTAGLRPDPRLLHEVRAQRLRPVRDRGDLLLLQQDLGLLLHVGLEVRREARVDVHGGERLAERLLRHAVAL